MKKSALLSIFLFSISIYGFSQNSSSWKTNLNEVKFISEDGKESQLDLDPGFRFAEFKFEGRELRFYFNRNQQKIKHIRINDEDTKLQIARGKGSWFWGSARMEFVSGETLKLKMDRNSNGYEIIGPYGPLFIVENQKIKSTPTINDQDFITQAFFVFDRIRETQKPAQELVWVYTSVNSNF